MLTLFVVFVRLVFHADQTHTPLPGKRYCITLPFRVYPLQGRKRFQQTQ